MDTLEQLTGHKLPEGMDFVDDEDDEESARPVSTGKSAPWKCEEHIETHWGCRFCIAAAIVEGSFDVQLLLAPVEEEDNMAVLDDSVAPTDHADLLAKIESLDEQGATAAAVFVKVAVWRRKFTRD